MESKQLKYFLAVARAKNFTKAAHNLFVTQPTISNQINRLENSLGVKLFKRKYHDISLTSPGLLLVPVAKAILQNEDSYLKKLQTLNELNKSVFKGQLKIGLYLKARPNEVTRIINAYHEASPDVKVLADNIKGDDLPHLLKEKQIDLAVGMIKTDRELSWQFLYEDHFVVVMNRNNRFKKTVQLKQLKTMKYINLQLDGLQDYRDIQNRFFRTPKQYIVHSMEAGIFNLESDPNAFMFLPLSVVKEIDSSLKKIELSSVDPMKLKFAVGIAWLKSTNNPLIQNFLQFAKLFS